MVNSGSLSSELKSMSIDQVNTFITMLNKAKEEKIHSRHGLEAFCEEYSHYITSNCSAKYGGSVKLTLSYLKEFFHEKSNLDEISARDAEHFILWLKKKAPEGYRVYFRNLKAAFNKAQSWEYVTQNPFAKVKLPKHQKEYPSYISRSELNKIIAHTENDVLKELFFFAFHTGCRLSEIVHLKWKNIDYEKQEIIIGDGDFITKSRSQRLIPIQGKLLQRLRMWSKSWHKLRDNPSGYVFANKNGYHFNSDYVSKSFKKACRSVGMDERIHFHSLRHSFASALVQNEANLYAVKSILGHSSITTTEIYSHLNSKALHQAVALM